MLKFNIHKMLKWWVEKIFRTRFFIPRNNPLPGRWQIKQDVENWMLNYYPDPGYYNLTQNSKKI